MASLPSLTRRSLLKWLGIGTAAAVTAPVEPWVLRANAALAREGQKAAVLSSGYVSVPGAWCEVYVVPCGGAPGLFTRFESEVPALVDLAVGVPGAEMVVADSLLVRPDPMFLPIKVNAGDRIYARAHRDAVVRRRRDRGRSPSVRVIVCVLLVLGCYCEMSTERHRAAELESCARACAEQLEEKGFTGDAYTTCQQVCEFKP